MRGFSAADYGDSSADVYDDIFAPTPGETDQAVDVLRQLAPLTGSVLEVGCGTGRVAIPLARGGLEVLAMDVSEKMLDSLGDRAAAAGIELSVRKVDISDWDPDGVKVDLVACIFNTLFMIGDHERQRMAIRNMRSACVANGVIVVETLVINENDDGTVSRGQFLRIGGMSLGKLMLSASIIDASERRIDSQEVLVTDGGVRMYPYQMYYSTLSDLDAMFADEGLVLEHRWGDWLRRPLAASGRNAISVYRLSADGGSSPPSKPEFDRGRL